MMFHLIQSNTWSPISSLFLNLFRLSSVIEVADVSAIIRSGKSVGWDCYATKTFSLTWNTSNWSVVTAFEFFFDFWLDFLDDFYFFFSM